MLLNEKECDSFLNVTKQILGPTTTVNESSLLLLDPPSVQGTPISLKWCSGEGERCNNVLISECQNGMLNVWKYV